MGARSDTKEKIQDVAMELFAEQGYDKTSLREIAERLGVTKAALYYHFKTKEEIITSLFLATARRMDTVVEWAEHQTPTPETRRELVHRYAEALNDGGRSFSLMRLMQENQPALRELAAGLKGHERMKVLSDFLTPPDATLVDKLRARLSLIVMHAGMFALREEDASDAERQAAALEVALSFVAT